MIRSFALIAALFAASAPAAAEDTAAAAQSLVVTPSEADGWVRLFNGQDLTGWKANSGPQAFAVEDGAIVVRNGPTHLFYTGDAHGGSFQDFELWVELMTEPGANSGIYFHTEWQQEGWPAKGYEVQINQTQGDARKTGGLYGIVDVMDQSPAADNEWHTQHVVVRGQRIVVRVNGDVTVDYTEPAGVEREERFAGRLLGRGTFALQGHDPGSVVRFRQIWVKPRD